MDDFGFIFTRHVTSKKTNLYWLQCYVSIRLQYPDVVIVIIDDNSDYRHVQCTIPIKKCLLLKSEFIGRGEFLPYYYLHKYRWFRKAIILQDSTFLQANIPMSGVESARFLWHFRKEDGYESVASRLPTLLSKLQNGHVLMSLAESGQWVGCFGGMTIMSISFLDSLFEKYNMTTLLDSMQTREDRMCFERILSLMCLAEDPTISSTYGDIKLYCRWAISYDDYNAGRDNVRNLPIVKVWSGR